MAKKRKISKTEIKINKSKRTIFGTQTLNELVGDIIERALYAPLISVSIENARQYLGEDEFKRIYGQNIDEEFEIVIRNKQKTIKELKEKKFDTKTYTKELNDLISELIIPDDEIEQKRKEFELIRDGSEDYSHKLANRFLPIIFEGKKTKGKYFWEAIDDQNNKKKDSLELTIDKISATYQLQKDKDFLKEFRKNKANDGYRLIHGANKFTSHEDNKYNVLFLEQRMKTEEKTATKLIKRIYDNDYSKEHDKINDFQALRIVTKDNTTHLDLIINLIDNFRNSGGGYSWRHKIGEEDKYSNQQTKTLSEKEILSGFTEIVYKDGTTIVIDSSRSKKMIEGEADVPYNAIHLDIAMNLQNKSGEIKTQCFELQIMDKQNYEQSEKNDPKKMHKTYDKKEYNTPRPEISYGIEKRISKIFNLQ